MARNRVGVPFDNPTRYVGPLTDLIPIIKVPREPTTSDTRFPLGQFWMVGDNPTTGTVGDLWYLCDYVAGVPVWCQIALVATGAGIDFLRDQVNTASGPDAGGNVDLDGVTVANAANPSGIPLETVAGTNKIDFQLQVGAARTGAPGDKNDAGVVSFDDTAFVVDADGWVTLVGGGTAIVDIDTDGGTAVPDGTGSITIAGGNGITTSASGSTVTIDLDSPVSVPNGGTGTTTLTGIVTANGTSPYTASTVTEGAVLLGGASNTVSDTGVLSQGDLIVGDGTGAPEILGVGSDGQILVANSSESAGMEWVDNDPQIITSAKGRLQLFTDFIGGVATDQNWPLNTFTAATNTYVDSDHPGVLSLNTTTVTVSHVRTNTTSSPFRLGGGQWTFTEYVKLSDLSDGTNTFKIYTGFAGEAVAAPAPPVDLAGFTYTHSESSGNWVANTTAASTSTTTDTGVAATTDWVELKTVINAAGTSIEFFIDNVSVATHTTNIFSVDFGVIAMLDRTAQAANANRRLDMDYWAIDHTLTNSRAP